jgi:Fic family protein
MSQAIDTVWKMNPNMPMAKQLAIRDIPSLVCDAVNLEGVAMTLPEIQTILDGITVGGHKITDQNMAINQADTWKYLFKLIEDRNFCFSKNVALDLHSIAGKEEALEWGVFRSGNVTISGSDYEPPAPEMLDDVWLTIESELKDISDIYDKAITAFLRMARAQFFWDVNKRMGRFMMNGILLSEGYPIINVPAKRQKEFNQLMLDFYSSGETSNMNEFLRSCLNKKIMENFKTKRLIG